MTSSDDALPRTRWEFRHLNAFYANPRYEPEATAIPPGSDLHAVEGYDWEMMFLCPVRFVAGGRDLIGRYPIDPFEEDVPLVEAAVQFEFSLKEARRVGEGEMWVRGLGAGPRFVIVRSGDAAQIWGENDEEDAYGISSTALGDRSEGTLRSAGDVLFATVPLAELQVAALRFSREIREYLLPVFPSLRYNFDFGEWFRRDD